MQEFTNLFEELFFSVQPWGFLGPVALVVIGYLLTKREQNAGFFYFILLLASANFYFSLMATEGFYLYHVLILIFGGIIFCLMPAVNR